MSNEITRREVLKRAAWVLGGTLSAPTILGVLSGCGGETRRADWTPRTLTPEQVILVAMVAETIIPETDTPGAGAARVDQFVDAMLTDHLPAVDRERFLAGLARVDARAQRAHGQPFGELSATQQESIVSELDRLAFVTEPPAEAAPGGAQASPRVREGDVATGPPAVGANPAEGATPPPDAADLGPESFFRMMKELAVVGYYTSEVGATLELRVNPMVPYRDIPYTAGTPSWA
jgi:hypothetical protein